MMTPKIRWVAGNRESRNMAICGDNLLGLRSLLEKPCKGGKGGSFSVDIIYIDPPYNVGGIQGYKNLWKGRSERGHDWARKSGAWLDFMEPRLKESHALLKEEGVMFISICDGEYHRLKVLMDLVFGAENNLGTFIWDKKIGSTAKHLVTTHEYILTYAKDIKKTPLLKKEKPGAPLVLQKAHELKEAGVLYEEAQKRFSKWINEAKGKGKISSGDSQFRLLHPVTFRPFRGSNTGMQDKSLPPSTRDLLHPRTSKACKIPASGWKWGKARFKKLTEYKEAISGSNFVIAGEICYGRDETTVPRKVNYLDEHIQQTPRSVVYFPALGARDLPKGLKFLTPKPLALMKELISYYPKKDAVILDYFAGSAATAQAVHELNKEDKGHRSWIVIEEMKSTFEDVIVPRMRSFDKDGDFGIYEVVAKANTDTPHSKVDTPTSSYSMEEQDFIRDKVGELSAEEIKVLYLLFWQDLDEQEAALTLGLSLAEVQRLKEKAFSTLRELYTKRFLEGKTLTLPLNRKGKAQDNLERTLKQTFSNFNPNPLGGDNMITQQTQQGDINKKAEPLKLCWFDSERKETFPAGVAFYDKRFGEYRLKIDIHPETAFYLKLVSWEQEEALYRVEVVIKSQGRFKCRKGIGSGYRNSQGDIVMNLWPYTKQILLSLGDTAKNCTVAESDIENEVEAKNCA